MGYMPSPCLAEKGQTLNHFSLISWADDDARFAFSTFALPTKPDTAWFNSLRVNYETRADACLRQPAQLSRDIMVVLGGHANEPGGRHRLVVHEIR